MCVCVHGATKGETPLASDQQRMKMEKAYMGLGISPSIEEVSLSKGDGWRGRANSPDG